MLVLLLAGASLAACGTPELSSEQATQVAVDAFAAAGLDATVQEVTDGATVDRAGDGAFIQVHQVDLEVDGVTYEVGVSRSAGAVVRLVESAGMLTDAEVQAIAEHRADPADSGATARRVLVTLVVLAVGAALGVALLRRARLAHERNASTAALDDISLD